MISSTLLILVAICIFFLGFVLMRRILQNNRLATITWLLICSIILMFVLYRDNIIQWMHR